MLAGCTRMHSDCPTLFKPTSSAHWVGEACSLRRLTIPTALLPNHLPTPHRGVTVVCKALFLRWAAFLSPFPSILYDLLCPVSSTLPTAVRFSECRPTWFHMLASCSSANGGAAFRHESASASKSSSQVESSQAMHTCWVTAARIPRREDKGATRTS